MIHDQRLLDFKHSFIVRKDSKLMNRILLIP